MFKLLSNKSIYLNAAKSGQIMINNICEVISQKSLTHVASKVNLTSASSSESINNKISETIVDNFGFATNWLTSTLIASPTKSSNYALSINEMNDMSFNDLLLSALDVDHEDKMIVVSHEIESHNNSIETSSITLNKSDIGNLVLTNLIYFDPILYNSHL